MPNKIKGRIWDAYVACERLCESDRDAYAWLRRAFDEACKGEKQHREAGRRFTDGLAKYKLPVADAARFFAVKWFLQDPCGVGTAADFCGLRPDAMYGQGAASKIVRVKGLEAWKAVCEQFAGVATLDYSEVFAA